MIRKEYEFWQEHNDTDKNDETPTKLKTCPNSDSIKTGGQQPDATCASSVLLPLQAKVRCKILSRKGLATDSSQERTYEQFFVEGTGGCGWGVFVHVSILPEGAK